MDLPDTELLDRWVAEQNVEAFEQLVARHSGMVYGACRRILGRSADAEDMVQECFIELAGKAATVKRSLAGWLYVVAMRRSMNCLKSGKRRLKREQQYAEMDSATGKEVGPDDLIPLVAEAVAELPQKFREPVVRRFLEGQTFDDITVELNVPRSTVQYRVRKGVERVRKKLKRRGVSIAAPALSLLLKEMSVVNPLIIPITLYF